MYFSNFLTIPLMISAIVNTEYTVGGDMENKKIHPWVHFLYNLVSYHLNLFLKCIFIWWCIFFTQNLTVYRLQMGVHLTYTWCQILHYENIWKVRILHMSSRVNIWYAYMFFIFNSLNFILIFVYGVQMEFHCILVFNYGVKYHFLSMGSEELSFRTHYFYRKLP